MVGSSTVTAIFNLAEDSYSIAITNSTANRSLFVVTFSAYVIQERTRLFHDCIYYVTAPSHVTPQDGRFRSTTTSTSIFLNR